MLLKFGELPATLGQPPFHNGNFGGEALPACPLVGIGVANCESSLQTLDFLHRLADFLYDSEQAIALFKSRHKFLLRCILKRFGLR